MFGIQGFSYANPIPHGITFMLDDTTVVYDQYGRVCTGKAIPGDKDRKCEYEGTHKEVIERLRANGIDWQNLSWAGFPQLPYSDLKKLKHIPQELSEDDWKKVPHGTIRKDMKRAAAEWKEDRKKEELLQEADA